MYALPSSVLRDIRIAKTKLAKAAGIAGRDKTLFDQEVSRIDIVAEITPASLPAFAPGAEVKSLYLLRLELKAKEIHSSTLRYILKGIPQNLLIAAVFEGKVMFAIHYGSALYRSRFKAENGIKLPLSDAGATLDDLYERLVLFVAGVAPNSGRTVSELLSDAKAETDYKAKVDKLKSDIAHERQPARKMLLALELMKLQSAKE